MSAKERDPDDQIRLDFASGVMASAAPGTDVVPAPGAVDAVLASARSGSGQRGKKVVRKDGAVSKSPKAQRGVKAAAGGERRRVTAAEMATKHREISVSEFFSKNRHLLGFDNPSKALLTTVKEGVDNSLDACEEAGILPEVRVEIHPEGDERFRVVIEDNGPGIVRKQVPKIFGSLLYGSKFHVLKQSRGQQGIGISAAGMYGLMTTGKSIRIISKTGPKKPGHLFELAMDTRNNQPQIHREEDFDWEKNHGTRVEITLQGTYKKGRHSVDGYLKQVAIANPHARILYLPPDGAAAGSSPEEVTQTGIDGAGGDVVVDGLIVHERVTKELPPEPIAIQPHPHGVELGYFLKMLQETQARQVTSFLQNEFSRVSARVAAGMLESAGLRPTTRPSKLSTPEAERLHKAMGEAKIMAPPTNCISPIGEGLLFKAIEEEVQADFHAAVTRPPAVYRGNPFQVEVGLAYGGNLPSDELVTLYRFANRVPLQYQQSACAITKAVLSIDWKKYQLSQSRGALPSGPMVLIIHIASVWVPFTSESKEAVAHYPEIVKEIRLALMEAGRKLGVHIRRVRREVDEHKKRSYIQKYIPHIGIALQEILALTDPEREQTVDTLTDVLEKSRKV
ncbi:MAG: DNA topoisomerase VI subunit B [Candidatus Eisenbacteria bacterium]|uniref:Type 2 DNA topoisomerase 6 subunit B n=1 Tax=Eiseniibacteriota bacterium TaxID=2212470 RepID=A0A956SG02_UNCEI|nr:DNA topoisomerase VI subunit B [Candidatus Eisenbacteria bacterium]